MRMYATIKTNTPVNAEQYSVSLGRFNMKFGEQNIIFDFENQYTTMSYEDKDCLVFDLRNLDIGSYADSSIIDNIAVLRTIQRIDEFFVSILPLENNKYPEITLKEIRNISFETSDGETYYIPERIVEEYNKTIC